jgi:hypothetical protein
MQRTLGLITVALLLGLLALTAIPVAQAQVPSSVATVAIHNTAYFQSGYFRSYVLVKTPTRLRVTISMVVLATSSGQAWLDAEACTTMLYTPCGDVNHARSFAYVPGWNKVRWRFTLVTSAPVNTLTSSVFDSINEGSASAWTNNQMIG